MLTTEFVNSLGTITGRHPLHLHVGSDVGDEEEWKGEIVAVLLNLNGYVEHCSCGSIRTSATSCRHDAY